MRRPEVPADEASRLKALQRYAVLDTSPEPVFDRLTLLAARLLDVPIAVMSLVDGDRQWFKSRIGLAAIETPRELAFCAHAILQEDVMTVADATLDERFVGNPLVTGDTNIRAYAGAPLRTPEGFALGTLCAIDHRPRDFTPEQLEALEALSSLAMDELELRLARQRAVIDADEHRRTADQLRHLLEQAPVAVYMLDVNGVITSWNLAAERVFGFRASEVVGRFLPTLSPDDQAEFATASKRLIDDPKTTTARRMRKRKDGSWVSVALTATPIQDPRLGVVGFLTIVEDLSEREQAAELQRASEESFRTLIERASLSICIVRDDAIAYANPALLSLLDYDHASELTGKPFLQLVDEPYRASLFDLLRGARFVSAIMATQETALISRDGGRLIAQASATALMFAGEPCVALMLRDVTEERRLEHELRSAARIDPLTGLCNRRAFDELVTRETARATRDGSSLSFALFDLDHFKSINDRYGHSVGDDVIRATAEVIKSTLRASDVGVRWGGEELLCMLPATNLDGARTFAERVRRAVRALQITPVPQITISGGVSQWLPGESVEVAVTRSDEGLYQAKTLGRDRVA